MPLNYNGVGLQGPLGGLEMNWRGAWGVGQYQPGDVVAYASKLYVCTSAVPASAPPAVRGAFTTVDCTSAAHLTLPTGTVSGDTAFIVIANNTSGGAATALVAPVGATAVESWDQTASAFTTRCTLYQYTVVSADISNGYLSIPAQGSRGAEAMCATFYNAQADASGHAASSSLATVGIAITTADTHILSFAYAGINTGTVTLACAALTGVVTGMAAGNSVAAGIGYETNASSGTSAVRTFVATGSTFGPQGAGSVAITASTVFPVANFLEIASDLQYPNIDIQVFTANGTWTKPTNAQVVAVSCIGNGAGGGAGGRFASGLVSCGGAGGSAGAMSSLSFPASVLTSTVAVTVGAGGAGAAAQTVDSTAGANAPASAVATTFGAYLRAGGGNLGNGGGQGVAGASNGGGSGQFQGGGGAPSLATGLVAAAAATSLGAPSGGGAGGGITATPTASAGSVGGSSGATGANGGAAGTVGAGQAGGLGASSTSDFVGTGGGGGAANATAAAGTGGAAGVYGAGGGGGGASLNGFASGGGGAGAGGLCVVISYISGGTINNAAQRFTATSSYTVPAGVTLCEITCVGGGGGGGGGGSALTAGGVATQIGGGGGGSGNSVCVIVPVTAGEVLTVTIGAGGAAGTGGALNGNAGTSNAGVSTTVVGAGVSVAAPGGGPGRPGLANSIAQMNGGYPGPISNYNAEATMPGGGGASIVAASRVGMSPYAAAGGGGGGAGSATATLGGGGAGAGTAIAGGTAGPSGVSGTSTGNAGGAGGANTGAGGGGGGGGAPGGAGGNGGAGGSGYAVIQPVG